MIYVPLFGIVLCVCGLGWWLVDAAIHLDFRPLVFPVCAFLILIFAEWAKMIKEKNDAQSNG